MGGMTASLREVALEVNACWCESTHPLPGVDESGGDTVSSLDGAAGRLWFTVVFPLLSTYRAGQLLSTDERANVALCLCTALPADTWYYGSREDHISLEPWGGEKKHSCVVVLVGCANPCGADDIRRRVEKLMPPGKESLLDVRACPPHLSPELGVDFESVARWVQARIEFVQAAGRVQPGEGVQCGVFGFSGILSVLEKQFGSASRDLTAEMILAKQYSDEEDGLLPGGFAPVLIE